MSDYDFMREMVAKAEANLSLNDGTTEPIKKIIAESDLVLAIWKDPSQQPHGVRSLIIKGNPALLDCIAANPSIAATADAIMCDNAEMAAVYRQTLGETTFSA